MKNGFAKSVGTLLKVFLNYLSLEYPEGTLCFLSLYTYI